MSDAYDVTYFDLEYCKEDVSRIIDEIKKKSSFLVIGMPGCGKSRLIDFMLNRPGVLEKYGLSNNLKAIRVDCDIGVTEPHALYMEILKALDYDIKTLTEGSIDTLRNLLIFEVEKLESNVDLVVIFDNFSRQLQQALGENFFNFLFWLRNKKQGLNIIYVFAANLSLDFLGFYKLNRLFDKGPDLSICWVSLLNRRDTFFSIDRQLRKEGVKPDILDEAHKERIYELTGGHALLTRHLSHLIFAGEVSLETKPDSVFEYRGIRAACEAIWNDLEQNHKNFLIDVVKGRGATTNTSEPVKKILEKYGILKDRTLFSPLFKNFVEEQKKASEVTGVYCDRTRTRIVIKTNDQEMSFALNKLSQKKRSLLCYLLDNQDETCTKDQLVAIGWPSDDKYGVSDQALSRHVDGIRSWFKEQPQLSRYIEIETCWGIGYKLVVKG